MGKISCMNNEYLESLHRYSVDYNKQSKNSSDGHTLKSTPIFNPPPQKKRYLTIQVHN